MNLTRFSLFFPERRDFFLDGATFFDFASNNIAGEQVQPYFSRRIGLSESATPQRIDYGTKFNGQVGAQDVGFLHVRTGDEHDLGLIGEEFTAARVKRRMLHAVLRRRHVHAARRARRRRRRQPHRRPRRRACPPRDSAATRT